MRQEMWSKTYSKKVTGINAEQVWKVWVDVNQWHTWHQDIEYAKLEGEFKVGNTFTLKPKKGPRVSIELIKVEKNQQFTDLTRFPGAKMLGHHEFIVHSDGLEIKTTMSIEGWLSFVWRKIVADDVAKDMPIQTESLIKKAKNG
jgi:hypothetical protein